MFSWLKNPLRKNKAPQRVRRGGRTFTLRGGRYVPDDGGPLRITVAAMLTHLSNSSDSAVSISDDQTYTSSGGGDFAGGGGGSDYGGGGDSGGDGGDCGGGD